MKAEGRFSGMRKKLKRIFSLALIVVMLPSLIPVCEAWTCDLVIGVGWGGRYTKYETFKLKGDISNHESGSVSYDMTLTLYDPHGKKIDSWHFSGSLSRGEYKEHIVYKDPPAGGWETGEYKICNRVIASGRGCTYNREVCTEITVGPRPTPTPTPTPPPEKPDLKITGVWVENGTIYYTIENIGNKKAGESNTSLTIDDVFITSDYVAPLNPGEARTESFNYSWKCTNKSHRIKVCADYLDEVDEEWEYNNCRTETWICKDLLIGYYIWSDDSTIYYEIANIGCERIEESYTSLTIDGVFITSDYVAPLEPGERRTESFNYSWKCTNKSDEIEVCADYKNEVEEGDEENNCENKTWKCSPVVKEWSKTFGGSGWDVANSVQQTSDGGYIIAGRTDSYGAGPGDAWLIKTDSSGKEEWSKTFGGSGHDRANSVQQTSDGGYIIAGRTNSYGAGSNDAWLIKTDSSGKEEWSKTFDSRYDGANSVQQTLDGGYIIAGYTGSYGPGYDDAWLIKTDSSGKEEWSKTFGDPRRYRDDRAYSIQQTLDGGYIIAGYTESYGAGDHDAWLIKLALTPPARKDLVISDIWSDNCTIYYKIRNRGIERVEASSTSLTIDDVFITSDYVAPLEPGEIRTGNFNYSWACSNKSDKIEVCADYKDEVEEYYEENNCLTETWTCPLPDLKITGVWAENSTIHYKIKNTGDKRAGESKTNLTIDGVFKASDYVAPLEPGEERTESFNYPWTCTNKSDEIKVCADYEDDVEESNEENNCRTETWTCPLPDMRITDVWAENSTIYYKIKNAGNKRAGESKTSLTIDDVFKASDYVAPLEPGEVRTESFNYSWACSNKSDKIGVCADYEEDIEEISEGNNCLTETWTCLPDLKITDVWGENSTIYYKIKNDGYKKAGESNTSLTIDDVFITSDYVSPLEPGEERTERFDYKWICWNESDKIKVCADFEDDVKEYYEWNNCLTETWTCQPDIWVSPTSFDVTLPPDVVTNYTLTIGNKGNSMLDFNVLLTTRADIDIPYQQGWPRYAGVVDSSPALGDIDGDGDLEIVVGSRDEKVYAWHHDGSTVKGWPRSTWTEVISSPALGDIDGDGDLEIVVGSSWRDGKIGGKLYVWHHNGSIVEGWPKEAGSYDGFSTPALGDIDRDGDLEIVVGENSIGSGISRIYAWHHDGSIVEGWPVIIGDYVNVYSSPALGDIDGDGDIEIVVGSLDGNVYVWHHNGSNVTGWPKKTGYRIKSSPALGDIDGDGDIEIVVGSDKVYAWHHDGSNVTGWPKKTDKRVESSPALGDIDGDGDIEIVVGSGDDKVYAWHHEGSNVTGWPVKTSDYVKSSPALGDIDGDGDVEVIVGSADGKVYTWHHDGSLVEGWPKEATYRWVKSSPALGDIDGDGDIEVVVGSYSKVCAWDCSGIYNPNNIEWGTFHHDVMRTGLYEPKPSGGFWLSIYPKRGIVEPGNQTNITVTFNTTGIPRGEYHLNITITSNDPDKSVLGIPVRLIVPHPPDLNITDIWIDNNTIYYKIKNTGDEKAGESNTSLTIDDVFITSDYVAPLEPGEERTESFNYTWNCTDESDVIKVCADYMGDVEEYNETNNCLTETRLCEAPAIWISLFSFDVTLQPDAVLNYTLTVGNKGNDVLNFNILLTTRADIDIPYQQGWPRRIWDDKVISSPALGDIDGDGDIEVVVGSYKGKVYAWHHNGSTVKGWPRYTGGEMHSKHSPALGDIDGDGDIEVVVGSSWDGGKRGKLYVWHHNGSIVEGWPKEAGSYDGFSTPALGDIDGDGDLEIVVGLYHISSEQGKVYAWHHDGSTVKGWPRYTRDGVSSSPALGDIDGDGDMEVVVGSYDNNVYAWHHNGSTVKGWPRTTGDGVMSSPVLGDIDGDGDLEIVVGSWDDKVYAWHHDGSIVEGWPKTTGRSIWSSPALGDMDKDGDIEVFICSYDGKVYAWHHDGSTVKGWPKTTDGGIYSSCYSPALGDIDGDGDIEVVVGSDDKVYAWHHDGSNVTGWPKKTGDYVPSPALGDIDGDGDMEVVVGSYHEVHVWDCSGIYNPNNIEWGTFHHDVMRTGLYEPKPSGGFWLSVYPKNGTLEPGNQTNITVTFNTTGIPPGEYHLNITITNNDPDKSVLSIPVHLTVGNATKTFDTGPGSYPSIMGVHNGTITPSCIITVSKLYTYPCEGTCGHAEYARIYNDSWSIETLPWEGYGGDWHNLSFTETFKLYANVEYKFTIRTGSYPQIHHKYALLTENGWINCTEFIDANGNKYNDWIPAIKLW